MSTLLPTAVESLSAYGCLNTGLLLVAPDSRSPNGTWKFSHKVSFTCSPLKGVLNDAPPEDAPPEDAPPREPTEKEKQEQEEVQNMSLMMAEIDEKAKEDAAIFATEEAEKLATNADVAVKEQQLAAKMLEDASWILNEDAAKQAREKGEQVAKEGAVRVSKEVGRKAAEVNRKAAEAKADQKRKAEIGRQARQHAEQNTSWFQAPTRKFDTRAKPRNRTSVGAKPGWFNS